MECGLSLIVYSSVYRPSDYESEGRGFKSHRPLQLHLLFFYSFPQSTVLAVVCYFRLYLPSNGKRVANLRVLVGLTRDILNVIKFMGISTP